MGGAFGGNGETEAAFRKIEESNTTNNSLDDPETCLFMAKVADESGNSVDARSFLLKLLNLKALKLEIESGSISSNKSKQ